MVRKKVQSIKTYRCPICGRSRPTLRGLAQHIAMKRDDAHVSWREKHGLPGDYKFMTEVLKATDKIVNILINKYGFIPNLNQKYAYRKLKKLKEIFL